MSSMWGRNGRVLRQTNKSKKYSLLGGVGLRKSFICFQPNRELTYTLHNTYVIHFYTSVLKFVDEKFTQNSNMVGHLSLSA